MLHKKLPGESMAHSPGLLWQFYHWLRGGEQVLVRPAAELPLVLISYPRGDEVGAAHLRESLEATWLTLPGPFRQRYGAILQNAPPLVVVLLRRRNICSCLGHHHPPGTESRLTRRLRNLSGVRTGELDLAYEAIRQWEPLPLSHLALPPEADTEEFSSFQWQLALLAVFLHEVHHLVSPQELEQAVRSRSQKFYTDVLAHFVGERYGVEYGLRRPLGD
ncbi:MAG: hypothetical protein A3G20_00830 [Acidobacteria bacterium RIFCSPLOWO2_12_FULL_59_11]|nr:MAG: hypothetical protein A3G20_00830 [Acidobacteria bacterium RIFCSPLOWO2_12_FULL_59_11]